MNSPVLKICLAGAGGIPGRNIISSILCDSRFKHSTTVLKRVSPEAVQQVEDRSHQYQTVFVDFDDRSSLIRFIQNLRPNVIISALNAEPGPILDINLVNSLKEALTSTNWKDPLLFINGYTLDIMHPSVSYLEPDEINQLALKYELVRLLESTSSEIANFEFATIVTASFLDYTLVKGYTGIHLESNTATIYDGGKKELTGCSLQFVGAAVVEVIWQRFFGTPAEVEQVRNKRVRIAETTYSGLELLEAVETATGVQFSRRQKTSEQLHVIGKLNWNGLGAATFVPGGLEFGNNGNLDRKRRTLVDIVKEAVEDGRQTFEGIGR